MNNKGIVYSLDAAFAVYLVLLSVLTFTVLFEYSNQDTFNELETSRLARDVYNIQQYSPGVKLPDEIKFGDRCSKSLVVGSAFVLKYDLSGGKFYYPEGMVCIENE